MLITLFLSFLTVVSVAGLRLWRDRSTASMTVFGLALAYLLWPM